MFYLTRRSIGRATSTVVLTALISACGQRPETGGSDDQPGDTAVVGSATRVAWCVHRPTSMLDCPDTNMRALNASEVTEVYIAIRTIAGTTQEQTFTPNEFDAVFFSDSAVQKFVLPYYRRTQGREAAEEIQQRYTDFTGGAPGIRAWCEHIPGSRLDCPDTNHVALPVGDIAEIFVSIRTTGGEAQEKTFEPEELDAILFTESPIQRFLVDYYRTTMGQDEANRIVEAYRLHTREP